MARERWSSPIVRAGLAGALLLASALNAHGLMQGARPLFAGQASSLAAALTDDPTTVATGQPVGFTWRVGGPSFAPLTAVAAATIDFGDGGTFYGGSGSGQVLNGTTVHAYAVPGTYSAVLQGVTQDGESVTSTATISVTSGARLAAVQLQALPASPAVGQSVSFTYSITGPPGTTATISYGDGTVETLAGLSGAASHAYQSAGTYAALLAATGNSGQVVGAASAIVDIGDSGAPGQPG